MEIGAELNLLIGLEVVAVPAHQRDQAAVFTAHRVDLSPASQEVVVDEADDVKPVGDDEGVGQMLADDRPVSHR